MYQILLKLPKKYFFSYVFTVIFLGGIIAWPALNSYKIPNQRQCVNFWKFKKVLNHSTLLSTTTNQGLRNPPKRSGSSTVALYINVKKKCCQSALKEAPFAVWPMVGISHKKANVLGGGGGSRRLSFWTSCSVIVQHSWS